MTRLGLLRLLGALALAGCGGGADDPQRPANHALLDRLPVYPGAADAETSDVREGDTSFAARDWSLPAGARAGAVVAFYRDRLTRRGWKIDGLNAAGLSAVRGRASVDVGVRGRTLELIARAR